jgi:hypothetical protein
MQSLKAAISCKHIGHIIFQSKSGQEIFHQKNKNKTQTPKSIAGFSFRLAGSADVNNVYKTTIPFSPLYSLV